MATDSDILRFLLRAEWPVSGEKMCQQLGVSRAAVWKHVGRLREQGYRIDSAPRRGYRLISTPETPVAAEIEAARADCFFGCRVTYLAAVDSTNRAATQLAEGGAPAGSVVLADAQTAGRGRLARSWFSPPGRNAYLSLILRPPIPPVRVPQLSLVAAVACARAMETVCGVAPRVKWPNDLYVDGRKVSGILCDMRAETDQLAFLILGIGINVNIAPHEFPEEIAEFATSLSAACGKRVNRVRLICELLDALELAYDEWMENGLAGFRDAWRERSLLHSRRITVEGPDGRTREGIVEDLGDDGALLLRTPDGRKEALYAGDVHLGPPPETIDTP